MTAARSIKTPVMTLPLLPPLPPLPLPEAQRRSPIDELSTREKAAVLQNRLRRLSFAEILRGALLPCCPRFYSSRINVWRSVSAGVCRSCKPLSPQKP
jgi:hypothetical protein